MASSLLSWLRGRERDGGQPPFPKASCHFCLATSIIVPTQETVNSFEDEWTKEQRCSVGSVEDWLCVQCQCWNRIDNTQEGGMASWESAMKEGRDEGQTPKRGRDLSHTTPAIGLPAHTAPFSFCHACQTNQTLVLTMIANYDDEHGQGLEEDEQAFEKWRADLERRYPIVCQDCQTLVNRQLQSTDRRARAMIWNDMLTRRADRRRVDGRTDDDSLRNPKATIPISWYIQAATLLVSWLFNVGLIFKQRELDTSLHVWDRGQSGYRQTVLALVCLSILLLPPLWAYGSDFNYSLPRQVRLLGAHSLRQKQRAVIVQDAVRQSRVASLSIAVLRMSSVLLSDSFTSARLASFLLCTLQWTVVVVAWRAVVVNYRSSRISLRSRAVSPERSQGPAIGGKRPTTSLPLNHMTSLSLDKLQAGIAGTDQQDSIRDQNALQDSLDDADEADNSMDWSPTLAPSKARASSAFTLGPQRFFEPLKQTGLEDLMATKLGLQGVEGDGYGTRHGTEKQRVLNDADGDVIMTAPTAPVRRTSAGRKLARLQLIFPLALAVLAFAFAMREKDHPLHIWESLYDQVVRPVQKWWQDGLTFVVEQQQKGGSTTLSQESHDLSSCASLTSEDAVLLKL